MKTIKMLFLGVMAAFAIAGCEDEPSLGTPPIHLCANSG